MARAQKPVAAGGKAKAETRIGAKAASAPSSAKAANPARPAARKATAATKPAPKAAPATKASPATKAAAATKAPAKAAPAPKAAPAAKSAPAARPARKQATVEGRKVPADKFLAEQQMLLFEERASHVRQAEALKEEADQLAAEMEPGESEFSEEGGEGGNLSIERELDLVLSAQAKAAVEEIERALNKIDNGTYGVCEKCGREIPRARLKVLPHAPLCVQCKSGGLSRR
jgi:DnaK suppressor protein